MKIFFDTLGCDKNTADNEYLAGLLRDRGVEIANRTGARDFDAVIITTCGFIAEARDIGFLLVVASRLLLIPVIGGLAYEILRFSGHRSDGVLARMLARPRSVGAAH